MANSTPWITTREGMEKWYREMWPELKIHECDCIKLMRDFGREPTPVDLKTFSERGLRILHEERLKKRGEQNVIY